MKVFIDTNILIDFVCRREPYAEEAKKLFAYGYMGKYKLMVCSLSFINTLIQCI